MATDYLSALNIGSGLNTTEIIDSIVAAERAPQEAAITKGKEKKNLQISGLGQVKQKFKDLDTNITPFDGATALSLKKSGTSVDLEITDKAKAKAFSNQIGISSLAAAETLVFGGFSSETAAVGTGSLAFAFGTWASTNSFSANSSRTSQTVTIDSTNNTLAGLRDAINAKNMDVTASILKTGATSFSLVVKSREGASHAMQITATENPGGSGLANLAYTSVDTNKRTVAASDAALTIDGTSVSRETNKIDDLIDGVTVTLKTTTSSAETISAEYDKTLATSIMEALVGQMNALASNLDELSKRGLNGAEPGPLAGDFLIRKLRTQLRRMTTDPINGFGSSSIYLADFGVKTGQDGSITLDKTVFEKRFNADPDSFAAIVNSRVTTGSSLVSATVTGRDYKPGVYAFALDGSGNGTIAGAAMTKNGDRYTIDSGDAQGVTITKTGNGASTNIFIGTSLIESLKNFSTNVLNSTADLATKLTQYRKDLTDYDDRLADLDIRIAGVRSTYAARFAAMESAVTSLKSTETSIKNMMDSWRASLKQ